MRAIHLPPLPPSQIPPFTFPSHPPPPSALQYSSSFPFPTPPSSFSKHSYLISVNFTALTRGELSWRETLLPERFQFHGGAIPGHDVVGVIQAVYSAAESISEPKFAVGNKVWGLIDFDRDGAASDFAIAFEDEIALLPPPPPDSGLNEKEWEKQMSTLPLSALTGYQALFEHADIDPNLLLSTSPIPKTTPRPRILILGPTGSVGLPTLHLCLASSLPTIAVTTSRHIPFLESLTDNQDKLTIITTDTLALPSYFSAHDLSAVDVLIDTIGAPAITNLLASPALDCVLNPGAKVISIVAPLENLINGAEKTQVHHSAASDPQTGDSQRSASATAQLHSTIHHNIKALNVAVSFFIVHPSSHQLDIIGRLATHRKIPGYVGITYPLEAGQEAMGVVERTVSDSKGQGKGRGKVVLCIKEQGS